MGERMMIALHHIVDAQSVAFVAGNCEAHGVGPVAGGKSRAGAPRIAHIAALPQSGFIGTPGFLRNGAAQSSPTLAQRCEVSSPEARQTPDQDSPSGNMALPPRGSTG